MQDISAKIRETLREISAKIRETLREISAKIREISAKIREILRKKITGDFSKITVREFKGVFTRENGTGLCYFLRKNKNFTGDSRKKTGGWQVCRGRSHINQNPVLDPISENTKF